MNIHKTKNKKGFTLIEVVVVLIILGIIAAVAVPSIVGYYTKSNQKAREESARSIFMVSQNAITHLYKSGREGEIAQGDGEDFHVDETSITPGNKVSDVEKDLNKDNIRYLILKKDQSNKENALLYKLIDEYISDKSIFDESIIVEYNVKTGKVLSAFYSDEVEDLGYKASSGYNIYQRGEDDLKSGHVGYWGVDSTGKPSKDEPDVTWATQLVDYTGGGIVQGNNINGGDNYGLLTLECALPSETIAAGYDCTIDLKQGASGGSTTVRSIKIGSQSGAREWSKLDSDFTAAVSRKDKELGMYLDGTSAKPILVIILDAPSLKYRIKDKITGIQSGEMTATLTATPTGDGDPVVRETVAEHTLFGDETLANNIRTKSIASVRHLQNIDQDVNQEESEYVQTADINCRDCYGNINWGFKPISEPNSKEKDPEDYGTNGFRGKYYGSSGEHCYKILDLTINVNSYNKNTDDDRARTGLFTMVMPDAAVYGVTIAYTDQYLTDYNAASGSTTPKKSEYFINNSISNTGGLGTTGGIAAINTGTISNCIVTGKVTNNNPGASGLHVGGIAGENYYKQDGGTETFAGKITRCTGAADVTVGGSSGCAAGGIVGGYAEDISYCEVGTASVRESDIAKVKGIPYFGARIYDSTDDKYNYTGAQNDAVMIQAVGNGGMAGGIAGEVTRSGISCKSDISYCVNAATVRAEQGAGGLIGKQLQGGTSKLSFSYNAGTVLSDIRAGSGYHSAGGLVGFLESGTVESCYNTGDVRALNYVGGLAGRVRNGTPVLQNSYSCGNVTYSDDTETTRFNGGIYGLYGKGTVRNCYFLYGSEQLAKDKQDTKKLTPDALKTQTITGMSNSAGGSSVGSFDYSYPYFNVSSDENNCWLGTNFHRTPWQ